MSDNLYLVLFSAITTGVFTLGAVYLTNRQNGKQVKAQQKHEITLSREKVHREKLEELYTLFNKHSLELLSHYVVIMRVMEGELSYNQALDIQVDNKEKELPKFERLEMLVDLYFPSLRKGLDQYFRARDGAGEVIQDHKIQYKQGNFDGEFHFKSMLDKLDDLELAINQLKSMIASLSLTKH